MVYAKLYDTGLSEAPFTGLQLIVQRYSAAAIGGSEQAEIEVVGTDELIREVHRWLGYYVVIFNDNSNKVWFGRVTQTTTRRGGRQFTRSLDEMANRIAVSYSYNDANGNANNAVTGWADDADSQLRYGVKEQLQSQGDATTEIAEALRDNALDLLSMPVKAVSFGGGGQTGGSLLCRGLWHTTAWRVFNQPGGLIANDVSGTVDHLLGWGFTSATVGFDATEDRIHDISARLEDLRGDDRIIVSGATNAGNNGTFTIAATTNVEPDSYTGTDIRFELSDDVFSTNSGFGFVQSAEMIKISGSAVAGNNRYYFAKDDVAADHITVNPGVTASPAGSTVTVEQGHSIAITGSLTTEFPSATVTLTALGTLVAQSFTMPVDVPFLVAEVLVRVKRVGTPADSLTVAIRTNSSGSPSGTTLDSVNTLGSTLTEDMDWLKLSFSATVALSYGTTYWLVISRTGSNDPVNYYMVDLSEDLTYVDGAFKLWNGSAWASRSPDVDMPFQIWSHRETTNQISDMLTTAGQFFAVQDIQTASGRYSRQYRDGNQTAQAELETLLQAGRASGRRFLSSVTPDRVVHVYEEPVYDSVSTPLLNENMEILNADGVTPWEPGKLPAGMWLTLTNELPDDSDVFIERAEYDAVNRAYTALEPKGAPNPWDVVKL
jgi:hypothetical protein